MRMDTLEYNELENLCLLLPEQDQLVLRGKVQLRVRRRLAAAGYGDPADLRQPPADTPVLTDTYDGVQVQLEGNAGHHHPESLRQRPTTWGDGTRHPGGTGAQLPHPWRLQ